MAHQCPSVSMGQCPDGQTRPTSNHSPVRLKLLEAPGGLVPQCLDGPIHVGPVGIILDLFSWRCGLVPRWPSGSVPSIPKTKRMLRSGSEWKRQGSRCPDALID
jgi:hypothetical protein